MSVDALMTETPRRCLDRLRLRILGESMERLRAHVEERVAHALRLLHHERDARVGRGSLKKISIAYARKPGTVRMHLRQTPLITLPRQPASSVARPNTKTQDGILKI